MRLTQIVHQRLCEHVRIGDIVVDATAGNGNDTLFLAQRVGANGKVYAFDIQATAILNTRKLIETTLPGWALHSFDRSDLSQQTGVILIHDNHASMTEYLDATEHKCIAAVTFNLGYLPTKPTSVASNDGSNQIELSDGKATSTLLKEVCCEHRNVNSETTKSIAPIITKPESTVSAIRQSLALLKPGGIVTIVVYVGHQGGKEEADAVVKLTHETSPLILWQELHRNYRDARSPRLFIAHKKL